MLPWPRFAEWPTLSSSLDVRSISLILWLLFPDSLVLDLDNVLFGCSALDVNRLGDGARRSRWALLEDWAEPLFSRLPSATRVDRPLLPASIAGAEIAILGGDEAVEADSPKDEVV